MIRLVVRTIAVLVAVIAAPGCDEAMGPASPNPSTPGPSGPAAVAAYLEELIGIMRAESANSRAIDWSRFHAEVLAAAEAAQSVQDAYPAIDLALRSLNDFESHYGARTGQLLGPSPSSSSCTLSPATTSSLSPTIGYVKVNGCPCEGDAADRYAEALQKAIRTADRPGLVGWIVDLRENGGGNMWPMMAGLGPILGEGIMGWIIYNNREYEREYRNGEAVSFGETFARALVPYTLLEPASKIAVLTGGGTNSAGEAITVWFKGLEGTRSFGSPTCGHHHLLQSFRMSDGATLTLKNANNADRLKRPYAGPIAPDEIVTNQAEVFSRAVAWLEGR